MSPKRQKLHKLVYLQLRSWFTCHREKVSVSFSTSLFQGLKNEIFFVSWQWKFNFRILSLVKSQRTHSRRFYIRFWRNGSLKKGILVWDTVIRKVCKAAREKVLGRVEGRQWWSRQRCIVNPAPWGVLKHKSYYEDFSSPGTASVSHHSRCSPSRWIGMGLSQHLWG